MIYQNGYNSTHRAIHGAEAPKKSFMGEVEPCQTKPNCLYLFYKVCVPHTDEPQQGLDRMCLQEEHKCLYLYLLKKGRYYYA